jgi:hypothetical protein
MRAMDRLNSLDASFIDAEDQDRHASFAIASIAVFEGPAPSYEEFLAAIAGRLPLVPLYRKKLRTTPFRLGPPVWVDDPDFDLRYHVRQTALPAPGGDQQLSRLMARVMTQRLDRDYPLWEYWLVEGLDQGRWALISKVHHCMVDGVSGTTLRTGISIFTYCGNVTFGITGDYATTPDIEVLARGIADGVAELVAAAEHRAQEHRAQEQRASGLRSRAGRDRELVGPARRRKRVLR